MLDELIGKEVSILMVSYNPASFPETYEGILKAVDEKFLKIENRKGILLVNQSYVFRVKENK